MANEEGTQSPTHKTVVTAIAEHPRKQRPVPQGEACLVVIYGEDIGRRIPLAEEVLSLGRSTQCDVHIDEESVSRSHSRVRRIGSTFTIRDLGSTNGTYVNDDLIDEIDLRDGDQIKIGRTIFKFLTGSNIETQYHEEIYRLMTVDGLTEVHNKRFFDESLGREVSRCRRYDRSFSLIIFDIDHFKRINDTFGHLAGDAVLRQLGSLVREHIRRDDTVCRIGGEEFAILTPEVDQHGAQLLAEKLRTMVRQHAFNFEGTTIDVTVSLGVATWTSALKDATEIVRIADEKLYEAKESGRDRVVA